MTKNEKCVRNNLIIIFGKRNRKLCERVNYFIVIAVNKDAICIRYTNTKIKDFIHKYLNRKSYFLLFLNKKYVTKIRHKNREN